MTDLTQAPPAFELEQEFQGVLARLRAPRKWWSAGLLLVGSLVAFLLVQQAASGTPLNLAVLVGVLLLHEGGHYLAMRLLGWQDVRMFFIPFFGAAVSGRRGGAASWKEGVVLLAGPVPGLLVGLALAASIRAGGDPALRSAAAMLLAINAFNLLPLSALDGGKVLQLTLFQRHRVLELAFLICAALGMVAASIWLEEKLLAYVAIWTLLALPFRARLLRAAEALRQRRLAVPGDARELEGEVGHQVFRAAWESLAENRRGQGNLAAALEGLVELVSRSIPSARQTVALLCAWGLGLGAGAGGLWLLRHPSMSWRVVSDPGGRYTLQLPGEPKVVETEQEVLETTVTLRRVSFVEGDYGFMMADLPLPEDAVLDLEGWWDETTKGMAEATKARILFSGAEPFQGRQAMAARLEHEGNTTRMAGFQHLGHRYFLFATAPTDDEALERFFQAVSLLPGGGKAP